jgi:NADPH:quinone reductase-like Zn-dependent oxidoreductase
MRAVVQDTYGSADVLQLRDVARPAPADGEVLVRVRAAGLDRGVWHVMAGLPYLVRVVVPLQGLRDVGEVQAGQRVLVIGAAGGVGSFAVQLAKAFGAQVTGVASTTQAELVRSLGADEVVDYTRTDVTDGSRHWDLILDTAGHRSLSRLRRALSPAGTLVIVGSEGRGRFMGGFDRQLRAVALSRVVGQRLRMLSSTPRRDDLETLRQLIEAGKVAPLLDRTFPLDQVRQAIGHLLAGGGRGKLVITV